MNENMHHRIREDFGIACLKLFRKCEKTARRLENFRNYLRFLLPCLHSNNIPRSIKLHSSIESFCVNEILHSAERKLLNVRIIQINRTMKNLNQIKADCLTEGLHLTSILRSVSHRGHQATPYIEVHHTTQLA